MDDERSEIRIPFSALRFCEMTSPSQLGKAYMSTEEVKQPRFQTDRSPLCTPVKKSIWGFFLVPPRAESISHYLDRRQDPMKGLPKPLTSPCPRRPRELGLESSSPSLKTEELSADLLLFRSLISSSSPTATWERERALMKYRLRNKTATWAPTFPIRTSSIGEGFD